jgi:Acyclic terpene utilisation family protein AtuA
VYGDDVLALIKEKPHSTTYRHLETGEDISIYQDQLVTANAYLGAEAIAKVISAGADIVITGRVADPSLTVGPCMAHYGWSSKDYDAIAGATVAGHLIECGTQATGGILTNWLNVPGKFDLGFPFVEVFMDGSFVITKPDRTGGIVNEETVKEQLLYEIGDPDKYLSPDATVSFLSLELKPDGADRIRITGAKGRPPPTNYKVSATYRHGFKAEGLLAIFGPEAVRKAQICGEIILEKVRLAGYDLEKKVVECIGSGDVVGGVVHINSDKYLECMLRVSVADSRQEALECFAKEIAPMVTSGPQGVTGYISGRPAIRQVFGYWPCLIERSQVNPIWKVL